MKKYKIGVIRVLTTTDEKILFSHQHLLEQMVPQFVIDTKCIDNQYEGIHDDETLKIAIPKIVELAKMLESSHDGIIVSCAGDPAVSILEKELKIPVVGGGKSTAVLSLVGGGKVGVLGIEDCPPSNYVKVLKDSLIAYEKPEGVCSTNDLQTEDGKLQIVKAANKLINCGIDTIAFACTGLTTANAKEILKNLDVNVVDAVEAEGIIMLYECIRKYGY